MAKSKSKPVAKKTIIDSKGYVLKGVPSWLLVLLKSEGILKKLGPKSRVKGCPVMVYPDNLYAVGTSSFKLVNLKNRKNNPGGYRFRKSDISKKYARLDDDNLKDFSRQLSAKYSLELGGSRLIPVLLPNTVITGKVLPYKFKSKKELIIAGQTKFNPKNAEDSMFFLDDVNVRIHHNYVNRYRLSVYHTNVLIDDVPSLVYTTKKLPEGKTFDFVVTKWFEPQAFGREDKPVYYAWDMNELTERFDDVYKIAGNVTGWDQLAPNWGYDTETSAILLISVMYMEESVPVFNTILFGNPRLGKSKMLEVFKEVFKEEINIGSQQTIKGLTGGFWEEGKEAGMLSANYVCLVDELFRTGMTTMSKIPDADHINNLMNDTLELLEHKKSIARSGKFDRMIFFDKSFMATNNIKDTQFLSQSFASDPAPHNRFTYLLLSDSVEEEMKKSFIPANRFVQMFRDRINKFGFNTKTYRKLFILMRINLNMVKVDIGKSFQYLKNCDFCHKHWDRREKFHALIKGFAMFNYVFREAQPFPVMKPIVPTDYDYLQAVNAMNRIIRDTKKLLSV